MNRFVVIALICFLELFSAKTYAYNEVNQDECSKTFELRACKSYTYCCPKNKCPSDQIMDDLGFCVPCGSTEMISINCVGKEEAERICPQRKICATSDRYTGKNGAIGSYPESYNEDCPPPGSIVVKFRCR